LLYFSTGTPRSIVAVRFSMVWSNKKIIIPMSFLQVKKKSQDVPFIYYNVVQHRNLNIIFWSYWIFDNPTIKKGNVVKCWILFLLEKISKSQ
jgi:hypothetical protein